jgi:hypothetical protein
MTSAEGSIRGLITGAAAELAGEGIEVMPIPSASC